MKVKASIPALVASTLFTVCASGHAALWSDTSIGVKVGQRYAEPNITQPIHKTVYEVMHIDGDQFGKNLVDAQILQSNHIEPAAGGDAVGAQEFYGFYRRSFSLSRLTGSTIALGPIKDLSLLARFDREAKNIAFATALNKTMAGVGVDWNVAQGFAESSLYAYHEKAYNGIVGRESNFNSFRVDTDWSHPVGLGIPLQWNGNFTFIGRKGADGFGHPTKPETRLYTELLMAVGQKTGFLVGIAFEAYRNKFGVNQSLVPGARQNTALLVAQYHF